MPNTLKSLSGMTDEDYANALFAARRQRIPSALREQEPGLSGGLDIGNVGGVPINVSDFYGMGIPNKLAMLTKVGFAPAMVGMTKGGGKLADMWKAAGSDPLYDRAIEVSKAGGRASTESLMRNLNIPRDRAAALINNMRESGLIEPRSYGQHDIVGGQNVTPYQWGYAR